MASKIGFKSACVFGLISGVILGGCVVVVHDGVSEWDDSYSSSVSRPRLGVDIAEPGRTLAAQLNIDRSDSTVITGVKANSPAERAGLKRYDIITAIDGNRAADPDDLRSAIRGKQWGDTINLSIVREGQAIEVAVPIEQPVEKPAGYPS